MVTKKRGTAKVQRLGECCPVLALALKRDVSKQVRRGFEVATPFGLSDGKARSEALIYRFPKGAKDEGEFKDTTYALVQFCPFCGTKLERSS
jgi:hypothetical protein